MNAQLLSQIKITSHTDPGGPSKTAVIVCHGMGQQVPFETLNLVAKALVIEEQERTNSSPATPNVRLLPDGDGNDYVARAEIKIKGQTDVHLYECYWAPLTEGKVSIIDVLKFLLEAGLLGIWATGRGYFRRFMFRDWRELKISRWSMLLLGTALIIVLSALVHVFALFLVTGDFVLRVFTSVGFDDDILARCYAAWIILLAACLLFLLVSAIITFLRIRVHGLCFTIPAIAIPLLAGLIPMFFGVPLYGPFLRGKFYGWIILGGLSWVVWFMSEKIKQYVGDVTAYVSAHKLNVFWEMRIQIQATCLHVADFVYGHKTDKRFTYEKIIFVGHSLGSVIAYDILNAAIRVDQTGGRSLDVVRRTSQLITFGSPLDKTAFLFREQMDSKELGVREALAMKIQPLIEDVANRPAWLNLYSNFDLISGALDYYNPPAGMAAAAFDVQNKKDPQARIPLLAHIQYWNNKLLRKSIYDAI